MPKAVFQSIYSDIKRSIESGAMQYQSLLLSENEFAKQYSCSRSTIRRALSELAQDGYVQPIQGKGVRVIWHPDEEQDATWSRVSLESFSEQADRMGFNGSTEVLAFERLTVMGRLAKTTGLPVGEEVVRIFRRRLADGVPVTTDLAYTLDREIPGLTPEIAASSTYAYIEGVLGLKIVTSKRSIMIEAATEDDRRLLAPPDSLPAVAVVRSQSYDSNGIMFEYSESRQHPYFFSYLDTVVRPAQDRRA